MRTHFNYTIIDKNYIFNCYFQYIFQLTYKHYDKIENNYYNNNNSIDFAYFP